MYENDYMYAIERSPEYLAHYGIRGMKWGVRKAIKTGNSKALSRQYAKAQKKLAKLENRAAKSGKYARRAALMGAGAATAGAVAGLGASRFAEGGIKLAGSGIKGLASGMGAAGAALQKSKHGKIRAIGSKLSAASPAVDRFGNGVRVEGMTVGHNLKTFGDSHSIGNAINRTSEKVVNAVGNKRFAKGIEGKIASGVADTAGNIGFKAKRMSNDTFTRIGAGAIGAGLAAGAAHNAYRAATAKKKAAQFRSEMNKAFAGTQYGTKKNRQGKKHRRG